MFFVVSIPKWCQPISIIAWWIKLGHDGLYRDLTFVYVITWEKQIGDSVFFAPFLTETYVVALTLHRFMTDKAFSRGQKLQNLFLVQKEGDGYKSKTSMLRINPLSFSFFKKILSYFHPFGLRLGIMLNC